MATEPIPITASWDSICCRRSRGRQSRRILDRPRSKFLSRAFQFDHGAKAFSATDASFAATVVAWEAVGVATRFGAFGWTGSGRMNAIGRHLAVGLDVDVGTEVVGLRRDGPRWRAVLQDGL